MPFFGCNSYLWIGLIAFLMKTVSWIQIQQGYSVSTLFSLIVTAKSEMAANKCCSLNFVTSGGIHEKGHSIGASMEIESPLPNVLWSERSDHRVNIKRRRSPAEVIGIQNCCRIPVIQINLESEFIKLNHTVIFGGVMPDYEKQRPKKKIQNASGFHWFSCRAT